MKKYALIFTKNLKSEYLGCNADFAQLTGYQTANQIIGKTDFDFHWGKTHAHIYRSRDQAVFAGQPLINFIEAHPLANGQIICVRVNKMPIYNEQGEVMGLTCHFQTIQALEGLKLTTIQTQCLYYLTQGFTAKEIAKEMSLSYRTVEFYVAILKEKLNCRNKAELISKALCWF